MQKNSSKYDVVVVGASFAGLTFAKYVSRDLRILILDKKAQAGSFVETTGLITQATYDLFADFCDIESYITNKITTIGVIAPDFRRHFFSHTDEPWIYSTDTPALAKHLAEIAPVNVEIKFETEFKRYEENEDKVLKIEYSEGGELKQCEARFLIGADGSHSAVARANKNLSENKRFLIGLEKLFLGDIKLGENPDTTVYHYWFGEFSLGYGGWLSPTTYNGQKVFRIGLAKLQSGAKDLKKIDDFIQKLLDEGQIEIKNSATVSDAEVTFAHAIPIGGVLKRVYDDHSLLLGDAAGFCGAFAADGIKGAVLSGKIAARIVPAYLNGDTKALSNYFKLMQKENKMMTYYKKQQLYRFLWDRMKSDRTFNALIDIIERERDGFLNQFCDSKDRHKSLMRTVLKPKYFFRLLKYGFSIFLDLFKRRS